MRVQYKRIEPNYRTLGAYYFGTDIENVTLSPTLNLLRGKLNLALSVGRQHDNLNNKKLATTTRTVGSTSLSWNPGNAFGIDAQYANYSTSQNSSILVLNDTSIVENVSQDFTLSPRFMFTQGGNTHSVYLSLSYQRFVDHNPIISVFSNANTRNLNISYSWHPKRLGLTLGVAGNLTKNETGSFHSDVVSGNLSCGGRFFNRALSWNLGLGLTSNDFEGSGTNDSFAGNLRISYTIRRLQTFSLSIGNISQRQRISTRRSFSELTIQLTYSSRFSL
jgi:hypothetical protein